MMGGLVISEVAVYLVAVLGLLIVWQYHQIQVLSGRIYAVDFWDVSGIRMLIHLAIVDSHTCSSCREGHGTVFLPSLSTKRNFSSLDEPCSNADGCRCLVIGLYGGWPEANRLVQFLRNNAKKTAVQLDESQLQEFFKDPWKEGLSAAGDRLSIHMLQGMKCESSDPNQASNHYQEVIKNSSGARDLRLVVPAFLRLVQTLEVLSRFNEAIECIRDFELRFSKKKTAFYFPTGDQRWVMATMKSHLLKMNKHLNEISEDKSKASQVTPTVSA